MECHRGNMNNNYDEWYSGLCLRCNDYYVWECNYHSDCYDDIVRHHHNNIVVIWKKKDFNGWQFRKSMQKSNITHDEYVKVLSEYDRYTIPMPVKITGKK